MGVKIRATGRDTSRDGGDAEPSDAAKDFEMMEVAKVGHVVTRCAAVNSTRNTLKACLVASVVAKEPPESAIAKAQ